MSSTLTKLLQPGILGAFQAVEVTEVFAHPNGQTPINVLTLAVAEEGAVGTATEPTFLGNG